MSKRIFRPKAYKDNRQYFCFVFLFKDLKNIKDYYMCQYVSNHLTFYFDTLHIYIYQIFIFMLLPMACSWESHPIVKKLAETTSSEFH